MSVTRNKVQTKQHQNTVHILINQMPFASVGVLVSNEGLPTVNGRQVIPAGTPIGGTVDALQTEQAILRSTNTTALANQTQGVLLHDVDVTFGAENATMLIHGFVNENRFAPGVAAIAQAKTALDGKVWFLRRNL